MGLISRVSSRTYRDFEMTAIRELNPYRRDVVAKKVYTVTAPEAVFKTVNKTHQAYLDVTNWISTTVDQKIVQPTKRTYHHIRYENGARNMAIIGGSTLLTRVIGRRIKIHMPIPKTQYSVPLSKFHHFYTFGVFYGACYATYPQNTLSATKYTKKTVGTVYTTIKVKLADAPSPKSKVATSMQKNLARMP